MSSGRDYVKLQQREARAPKNSIELYVEVMQGSPLGLEFQPHSKIRSPLLFCVHCAVPQVEFQVVRGIGTSLSLICHAPIATAAVTVLWLKYSSSSDG